MQLAKITLFVFGAVSLLSPLIYAETKTNLLDINVYPYLSDVDSDNSVTVNLASKFSKRYSYFSLTNAGSKTGSKRPKDINRFYTEQNVRWQVAERSPFDLTLQMNFRSGSDNDRHRLGIRWRVNHSAVVADFFNRINLAYSINLHAIQFDHEDTNVWQVEHVYQFRFPSISEKLYLAGFIDHTFNQNLPEAFPKNPIVAEAQLGYRIAKNFHLIAEYRVNEYRRTDVNNLAMGVQYKVSL